ncbi:MAG: putative transporter [Bacteroidetes bacterium]|nr:MAG: putative transporter [Bacteroidota bacterium]
MNWLTQLFTQGSVAHDILIYSLVIALGLGFGKFKIFGISLGITWVLFFSILFANLKLAVNQETNHFLKEFGLAIFVYCIGLQVGPSFFNSLKKDGLKANFLAVMIVFLGVVVSIIFHLLVTKDISVTVGLMSGAVTNTPGLGAAQAVMEDPALQNKNLDATEASIAYAVTYPLGVLGIILIIIILKKIWKINIKKEQSDYERKVQLNPSRPITVNLSLKNAMLFNKPFSSIRTVVSDNFVVSRILQNNSLFVPTEDTVLKEEDVLLIMAPKAVMEKLELVIGEKSHINLEEIPSDLITANVVVTRRKATVQKLQDIDELNRPDCQITRIERSGIDIISSPNFVLHIGDVVTVVGTKKGIDAMASLLGNAIKRLDIPELAPIFFGLFLGVILGSIPFRFPGIPIPVKIGLAGGPLIVALLISQFGNRVNIYNYTTYSANLMVRELGISLFLASIGLSTGSYFMKVFETGKGLEWIAIGFAITIIPLLITSLLARYALKRTFFEICGLLAGASTDPPALAFALQLAGNSVPSLTYATVYPLSMFARILAAELIVLGFA